MPDQLSVEILERNIALNGALGVDQSHSEHTIGKCPVSDSLVSRMHFSRPANTHLPLLRNSAKLTNAASAIHRRKRSIIVQRLDLASVADSSEYDLRVMTISVRV